MRAQACDARPQASASDTSYNLFNIGMTEVTNPLRRVTLRLDEIWIPLSDGTRLAATIWLPTDANADPVPAILGLQRKTGATALSE